MKYSVYLFGGLYDESYNKQDMIDTVEFLEDDHGPGSAYMEESDYPVREPAPYWADDVVY